MKKIAFLHPGQGSQKLGMGRSVIESYPPATDILNQAQEILGFDVEKLCSEGPEEKLNRTLNLQPSLLTINWILTKLLKKREIAPQAVAGHSLGEYNALLTAGVIDFPTALKIVKQRAYLMEKAGKEGKGAMAAIIGLEAEKIIEVCKEVGKAEVVNFNCPGQVVVSGCKKKVVEAMEKLKKLGAKKVVSLPVSGAFHSFLMRNAAKEFSSFLDKFSFNDPALPVVSNATGRYATSANQIKNNLKLQMDHPVLWEKGMRVLLDEGFNTFVEVGPGKVLQGLMRRINRKVAIIGVENIKSANQLVSLIS